MLKVLKIFTKVAVFLFFILGMTAGKSFSGTDDLLPARSMGLKGTYLINPDAGESTKPEVYNLKQWVVEENTDPVQHALEVYKKKSEPGYNKSIWITNRNTGQKHLIAQYAAANAGNTIVFSGDEKFMYYLGVAPGGQNMIYGVDLSSDKKFSFGAGNSFSTVNCPNKKSFVVIQEGKEKSVYQVYTTSGKKTQTLNDVQPVDLEKNLCR